MEKITIEKLLAMMNKASQVASSVSADSEGSVDGNDVYIETLVSEINDFFYRLETQDQQDKTTSEECEAAAKR